jgi:hypothetical protein
MDINFVDEQLIPLLQALSNLNAEAVTLISTASAEIYANNPEQNTNSLTRGINRLYQEITSLNHGVMMMARARRQMQ